jgi:hypothetical protein
MFNKFLHGVLLPILFIIPLPMKWTLWLHSYLPMPPNKPDVNENIRRDRIRIMTGLRSGATLVEVMLLMGIISFVITCAGIVGLIAYYYIP